MAKGAKYPDEVIKLAALYDAQIEIYRKLVEKNNGYINIPRTEMDKFNAELIEITTTLHAALKAMPKIEIYGAKLLNNEPLNHHLQESFPAMFLFYLARGARSAADLNELPELVVNSNKDVVGVESLFTDTIKALISKIPPESRKNLPDFNKENFLLQLEKAPRKLKIFHAFHKAVNRAYPLIFDDIELFLKYNNHTPDPVRLETSQELAAMIYGMSKGFWKENIKPDIYGDIRGRLVHSAGEIAKIQDFSAAVESIHLNRLIKTTLELAKEIVESDGLTHIIGCTSLIEKSIEIQKERSIYPVTRYGITTLFNR